MDYNFIKCLHPQRIINKYTGEVIITNCGHCEACRLSQAFTRTMKCNLESATNKYLFFVTLTYAKEYVPTMKLISCNNGLDYNVIRYRCNQLQQDGSVSHYISGDFMGHVHFPHILARTQLMKKMKFVNDDDLFYTLDYRDVQLFIKRLRKRINNERIRVFTCGEYGCVHFRPHYHLLLWCNRESTQENMLQYISESWPFGRVDASLSNGSCTSYVARYVNGSQYLPSLLKVSGAKPFSHHSRYLGEKILQSTAEEIPQDDYRRIAKRRISFSGFNSDVILWRSVKNRLYPRCSGFSVKSEHECVMSYKLVETARTWFDETKTLPVIQIARKIADYVDDNDSFCEIPVVENMLQYFMRKYLIGHPPEKEFFDKDKFCRMVYVELLQSQRFLSVKCDFCSDYETVRKQYRIVKDFYNTLDYDNLVGQIKYIQKTKSELWRFFYTSSCFLKELKKLSCFQEFKINRRTLYSRLMKHRELNDKNLFFNY